MLLSFIGNIIYPLFYPSVLFVNQSLLTVLFNPKPKVAVLKVIAPRICFFSRAVFIALWLIVPFLSSQANANQTITQNPLNQNSLSQNHSNQNSSNNSNSTDNSQTDVLFSQSQLTGDFQNEFIVLNELNVGLYTPQAPNLHTPLALLEFFETAVLMDDFALASHALNLNAYPAHLQAQKGADLAFKLDYLLNEKGLYIYDELPDRPDGVIEPTLGENNPLKGVPRRSIKIGTIDYKSRKIPIYIERVYVKGRPPVWVFARASVENIDRLYEVHKPADFEKRLPNWLTSKLWGVDLWEWLALLVLFAVSLGFAYWVNQGLSHLLNRLKDSKDSQQSKMASIFIELINRIALPLTITLAFGIIYLMVSGRLPYVQAVATSTRPIIWVVLLVLMMWLGIRVINFFANRYENLQIDSLNDKKTEEKQKRKTYLSIFRRIFIFVMILSGSWYGLGLFVDLKSLGKILLTSAGILGAVAGIAAQSTLGNIIAGIQVATTQPIRIGDALIFEQEWCTVEDLRYTYAVLLTWDKRRLIVPMRYFVTEVIENWTHTNAKQSTMIYLYVDYCADFDYLQDKFMTFAKAHILNNGDEEPALYVYGVNEKVVTLVGMVSADTPSNAWQIACDIRKQLLDYLGKHAPHYLPQDRIQVNGEAKR